MRAGLALLPRPMGVSHLHHLLGALGKGFVVAAVSAHCVAAAGLRSAMVEVG